jgi:hypothetical protein
MAWWDQERAAGYVFVGSLLLGTVFGGLLGHRPLGLAIVGCGFWCAVKILEGDLVLCDLKISDLPPYEGRVIWRPEVKQALATFVRSFVIFVPVGALFDALDGRGLGFGEATGAFLSFSHALDVAKGRGRHGR